MCLSGNPANTSQRSWICPSWWSRGSITCRITGTGFTGAPNRDGAFARPATSCTSSRLKSCTNAVPNSTRTARRTWSTQQDTRGKTRISSIYFCCQKYAFQTNINSLRCALLLTKAAFINQKYSNTLLSLYVLYIFPQLKKYINKIKNTVTLYFRVS